MTPHEQRLRQAAKHARMVSWADTTVSTWDLLALLVDLEQSRDELQCANEMLEKSLDEAAMYEARAAEYWEEGGEIQQELEAERAAHAETRGAAEYAVETRDNEIADLQAKLDRLVEALEHAVGLIGHDKMCPARMVPGADGPCNCALLTITEALSSVKGGAE